MRGATSALARPSNSESAFCWGAFGVIQRVSSYGSWPDLHALDVCVPSHTTRVELVQTFRDYMARHPDLDDQDFTDEAFAALRYAFPCAEK